MSSVRALMAATRHPFALIKLAQDLGFGKFEKGLCYGVAATAAGYLLKRDFAGFTSHYNAVTTLGIADKIKTVKAKLEQNPRYQPNAEEQHYIAVQEFIRGILIHQSPGNFSTQCSPRQQNALKSFPLTQPETPITRPLVFSGIYEPMDLTRHFSELRQTLQKYAYEPPLPLVLENENHAITVCFSYQENKWALINSNRPVQIADSEVELAEKIRAAFYINRVRFTSFEQSLPIPDTVVIGTSIFTTQDQHDAVLACLEGLQQSAEWQRLHRPNPTTIHQSPDHHAIQWLNIAALTDDSALIERLLSTYAYEPPMINPAIAYNITTTGDQTETTLMILRRATPDMQSSTTDLLMIAIENRQPAIVEALLKLKPGLNHSPGGLSYLSKAIYTGNAAIVRLLLEHHANPMLPDRFNQTPLQAAKLNGHPEIIHLLEEACERNAIHNQKFRFFQPETGTTSHDNVTDALQLLSRS